jgi:hypothetical protein
VDPIDFLMVTAQNLKDAEDEADTRTSISRSYYALYNEIRNKLEIKGSIHFIENHGVYNIFFGSGFPDEVKDIGTNLSSLYAFRRKADYDMNGFLGYNQANTVFYLARETLKLFQLFIKKENQVKTVINHAIYSQFARKI